MTPERPAPRDFARAMNNLTPEQIAQAMETLPTDALEFAVKFEALGATVVRRGDENESN